MTPLKRFLIAFIQVVAGLLLGLIASWFIGVLNRIDPLGIGVVLIVLAIAMYPVTAALGVWLIGRIFGLGGSYLFTVAGAVIGSVIAWLITSTDALATLPSIGMFSLLLLAPLLATVGYQWSAARRTNTPEPTANH